MLLYQEGPITFDYDPKFDTLYASINGKDKSHSYGDDRVPGLVVARDINYRASFKISNTCQIHLSHHLSFRNGFSYLNQSMYS